MDGRSGVEARQGDALGEALAGPAGQPPHRGQKGAPREAPAELGGSDAGPGSERHGISGFVGRGSADGHARVALRGHAVPVRLVG